MSLKCTFPFLFFPTRGILVFQPGIKPTSPALAAVVPTLCDPIDGSPPGSPVPGILQARKLEWAAISFSNACMHAKSLQSCLTLCDTMDSSPPGSSVHRILQAKILEWVPFPSPSPLLGPCNSNVVLFNITPEALETILNSFHSFFSYILLFSSYLKYSIFQLQYFEYSSSNTLKLQCFAHM